MKKLKFVLIETFVILLTQLLNETQAGCTWGTNNCDISCSSSYTSVGSETAEEVMKDLGKRWNERENCHADGIRLTLTGVYFSDNTVKANWFTAHQVNVKELVFWISTGTTFEANAFNSTALKYVTKLTFPSTSFKIGKGIFNGLESLEELTFQSASLQVIEYGVLDPFSGTLKRFSLIASSSYWSEIYVNGFTGSNSQPLTALTYVKYEYTLKSTLTHSSFVALQNVITLDLSDCQIETIGAGTFDPISNSVRELNLNNNKITTLPGDIFGNLLFNDVTSISLNGNKWVCDCNLMPFKMNLMESTNFGDSLKCNNPIGLRNSDLIETDFCSDYVPPSTTERTTTTTQSTTTTTTQSTTTTTTTTTTTSPNTPTDETTISIPTEPSIPEGFTQVCYEAPDTEISKDVFIQAPRSFLRINENIYGDVILEVDKLSENSVLLWFSQLDRETTYIANNEISCVIGRTQSIPITNLKEDTAYTFCLMDSTEKTVSPLDCISYTKVSARELPWIRNDNRSLIISMVVLACFFSVLIGWAVGFFTLHQIIKKRNQPQSVACINDVLKEAFQSNSMKRQHRMFSMTISSASTKRTTNYTIDYYIENAPPLPARPFSMHPFEEPIYAVVRDPGTLK